MVLFYVDKRRSAKNVSDHPVIVVIIVSKDYSKHQATVIES
jgi:hypothetical protein